MTIEWEIVGSVSGSLSASPEYVEIRGSDADASVAAMFTDMYPGGYPEALTTSGIGQPALSEVDGFAVRWAFGGPTTERDAMLFWGGISSGYGNLFMVDNGDDPSDPSDVIAPFVGTGAYSIIFNVWYESGIGHWYVLINDATAGGNNYRIYYSDNYGRLWRRATRPPSPPAALNASSSWSAVTRIATGMLSLINGVYVAFSSDNGATWTTRATLPGSSNAQLATDGSGVVITSRVNGAIPVYRSFDDGVTWASLSLPTVPVGGAGVWDRIVYFGGAFIATVVRVISGTKYCYVARSTDSGTTWAFSLLSTTTNSGYTTSILSSSTHLYLIFQQTQSFWSSDGLTWNTGATYIPPHEVANLTVLANDTLIKCDQTTGNVKYSSDHGATWTSLFNIAYMYPNPLGGQVQFTTGPMAPPRDWRIEQRNKTGAWSTVISLPGKSRPAANTTGGRLALPRGSSNGFASQINWFAGIAPPPTNHLLRTVNNGASWITTPVNLLGDLATSTSFDIMMAPSSVQLMYASWLDLWFRWFPPTWNTADLCAVFDPNAGFARTVYTAPGITLQKTTVMAGSTFYQLRAGPGSGTRGIYSSTDGNTWTLILSASPVNYGGRDLSQGVWSFAYATETATFALMQDFAGKRILTSANPSLGFTVVNSDSANLTRIYADGVFFQFNPVTAVVRTSMDGAVWSSTAITSFKTGMGENWDFRCTSLPLPTPSSGGWSVGMIRW